MACTLGIDIGTYQTKGVLVDEAGKTIARAERDHEMIVPRPGWAEHRAEEDWWGDFVAVARAILAEARIDPDGIRAVACSAIGPCMLPVDASGRPLSNGALYGVDTRAQAEIDELNARIGEDLVLDRCGNALTSQAVGPKILWLKNQHPEIHDRAAKILTSTSYLVWKLTGEYAIDHYTASGFAPLYDMDRQTWTDELAPDILPLDKLPRLSWSSEIVGEIGSAAAAETGLAPGTPVTAGTIDAAAEAVSVGARSQGDMMMMYGSTIFMIAPTDSRVRDPRLWSAPWLFPGGHAAMAGLATSGTLTRWFRDRFARELGEDEAFGILAEEAAASPKGARGLLFLPYFSGERTPIHDPDAKGCFFGLNLTHSRGDLYRALIEGIAYGANHAIDAYAEIGLRPERLFAVGGGTRNRLWLHAISDVTGLDQIVRANAMGASYGDAFIAALAVGAAAPDDISQWNPVAENVVAERDPAYDRNYALFRRLYEQTKDIAVELKP